MTREPPNRWQAVTGEPRMRSGRGSVLGPDTTRRTRWWELTLECGHRTERNVRYRPEEGARRGGTQRRKTSDVLPAPTRVRCEECGP